MNKLETTLRGVNGDETVTILTGKSEYFDYKGDKKVNDVAVGMKYTVSLPGNRMKELSVKIVGADQIPNITDEQISESLSTRKFILVKFTDCKVTVYNIGDGMIMSAFAKSAELVKSESSAKQQA